MLLHSPPHVCNTSPICRLVVCASRLVRTELARLVAALLVDASSGPGARRVGAYACYGGSHNSI